MTLQNRKYWKPKKDHQKVITETYVVSKTQSTIK